MPPLDGQDCTLGLGSRGHAPSFPCPPRPHPLQHTLYWYCPLPPCCPWHRFASAGVGGQGQSGHQLCDQSYFGGGFLDGPWTKTLLMARLALEEAPKLWLACGALHPNPPGFSIPFLGPWVVGAPWAAEGGPVWSPSTAGMSPRGGE